MCTVNRPFKHIIPNDGNVTCCRTLRIPICYKAAAIGQSLIDACSFVTYGYPEGSAAGDITIIWNYVFKWSVDCAHPFLSFIYFLSPSPSPSHGVPSFLGFENLFAIYIYIAKRFSNIYIYIKTFK